MPETDRDLSIGTIALITLACLAPIVVLLASFDSGGALSSHLTVLVIGGIVYITLMSFFVSSVCGYMAGLIGSSNSPISGIGILAVLGASLLLVAGVRSSLPPSTGPALVAFALFVTAVIFAVACIANNNLQDLKTGQLVGATPWKQQVALIIGVIAGAVIIPPVMDLLNHAYGFAGAPGPNHEHPLPAPQAGLMSALAQGVLQNNVDWSLIGTGVLIGVGLIILDAFLRRARAAANGETGISFVAHDARTLPFPTGPAPNGVAVSPSGRLLYAAYGGSSSVGVYVIDPNSRGHDRAL